MVHGPFQTPLFEDRQIYFEQNQKEEIQFILSEQDGSEQISSLIDTYEIEGGEPNIESVFFDSFHNKPHIFVIVSWPRTHRELGTYGIYYQVYAYYKNAKGHFEQNPTISYNPALSGIDGHSDSKKSIFKYKTASAVKQYLRKK